MLVSFKGTNTSVIKALTITVAETTARWRLLGLYLFHNLKSINFS